MSQSGAVGPIVDKIRMKPITRTKRRVVFVDARLETIAAVRVSFDDSNSRGVSIPGAVNSDVNAVGFKRETRIGGKRNRF